MTRATRPACFVLAETAPAIKFTIRRGTVARLFLPRVIAHSPPLPLGLDLFPGNQLVPDTAHGDGVDAEGSRDVLAPLPEMPADVLKQVVGVDGTA